MQEKFHAITYNPDLDKIVAVGEKGWRAYGSNPEDMSGVSWYLDQSVRYMGITYVKVIERLPFRRVYSVIQQACRIK
ncbi:hypothetical protein [Brevibacillus invocatus]|uniref:hypothetical protein n=1 Tax=Brevibacillus invocatus TaxID=173959 RepID=UPI00203ECA89|nr:hypothetical protein [Brevibacillus invocatus]MCM3431433.1 hypothetical protein [Brevibacillus invocatus]